MFMIREKKSNCTSYATNTASNQPVYPEIKDHTRCCLQIMNSKFYRTHGTYLVVLIGGDGDESRLRKRRGNLLDLKLARLRNDNDPGLIAVQGIQNDLAKKGRKPKRRVSGQYSVNNIAGSADHVTMCKGSSLGAKHDAAPSPSITVLARQSLSSERRQSMQDSRLVHRSRAPLCQQAAVDIFLALRTFTPPTMRCEADCSTTVHYGNLRGKSRT